MQNNELCIIIGGSSGMGLASAKEIASEGYDILIVSRDQEKMLEEKQKLEAVSKGSIEISLIDLYNIKDIQKFIQQVENEKRHIKYLINAAGFFKPVSFLEHSHEDYDKQMDINKAFFFITQAVAKNMKQHGSGSIVNIGSMWAHQAVKATPSSAYSMQKAGLHSLTQHLAMELADYGIRVNAVAPAVVLSSIYKSFIPEDKIQETLEGFNNFHPIGRIGVPEDVSKMVKFLLSDNAAWITGTVVNVDGGVMAGRN